MLIHLPREEGYRHKHTVKNGPALAGYGAVTMKNALAATITTLPEQLRRSLIWDRGEEMWAHAQFKVETGLPVFFADPDSLWQRGMATLNNRPARASAGRHQPKHSASSYSPCNKPVLRRSIEPSQYTSIAFTERLAEARIDGSVGAVGDALDNALPLLIGLARPRG